MMARFALTRATLLSLIYSCCLSIWHHAVVAAPSSLISPKSFLSISHPTLPEYFIRLTQPDTEICDPSVNQYSGYLDDEVKDKHFFFWFFESRNDPKTDPLVLWLNGGPGCSSMTGLFLELGPCQLSDGGNGTQFNPYSWNNNASIIFLDQPINVGYSYGADQVHDSTAAAQDVFAFLQLFMSQFPEYSKLDFHVAGESYAGHYIPAIGKRLVQEDAHNIQLKSLMIGNGLTDPLTQYAHYTPMACDNDSLEGRRLLDDKSCEAMKSAQPKCNDMISQCYADPDNHDACISAAQFCNDAFLDPYYDQSGLSPYDIRKSCKVVDESLCDDHLTMLQKYLNHDHIKQAIIGLTANGEKRAENSTTYANCNLQIHHMFQQAGDWMRPYVNDIPPLLDDAGIRIFVYAGDQDYVCNWIGNKEWTMKLPWHGQEAWLSAEDREWGNKVGQLRTTPDGQFAFLRVYDAGHMVPSDQPEHALDFFNAWIQNRLN